MRKTAVLSVSERRLSQRWNRLCSNDSSPRDDGKTDIGESLFALPSLIRAENIRFLRNLCRSARRLCPGRFKDRSDSTNWPNWALWLCRSTEWALPSDPAFQDVCWKNLGDSGFPDRIAWMKAAAEKYPWMDLSRVGIYGGSAGGQSALRALLAWGDFYKAAAADCGCHDNRMDKIWWNELYMGWPVGPHYQEQSTSSMRTNCG